MINCFMNCVCVCNVVFCSFRIPLNTTKEGWKDCCMNVSYTYRRSRSLRVKMFKAYIVSLKGQVDNFQFLIWTWKPVSMFILAIKRSLTNVFKCKWWTKPAVLILYWYTIYKLKSCRYLRTQFRLFVTNIPLQFKWEKYGILNYLYEKVV